jgi:hypothetical protein
MKISYRSLNNFKKVKSNKVMPGSTHISNWEEMPKNNLENGCLEGQHFNGFWRRQKVVGIGSEWNQINLIENGSN